MNIQRQKAKVNTIAVEVVSETREIQVEAIKYNVPAQ